MKSNYLIVPLIVMSLFSLTFCGKENKKQLVASDTPSKSITKVKKSGGKCCSSIPARFPAKPKFVSQPEKLN